MNSFKPQNAPDDASNSCFQSPKALRRIELSVQLLWFLTYFFVFDRWLFNLFVLKWQIDWIVRLIALMLLLAIMTLVVPFLIHRFRIAIENALARRDSSKFDADNERN